jgi:hypothetical protein
LLPLPDNQVNPAEQSAATSRFSPLVSYTENDQGDQVGPVLAFFTLENVLIWAFFTLGNFFLYVFFILSKVYSDTCLL